MSEPIGFDRKSLGVKPVFRQIFIKRLMVAWIITVAVFAVVLWYISDLYRGYCRSYIEGIASVADYDISKRIASAGDVSGRCIILDRPEDTEVDYSDDWYVDVENYDQKTAQVKKLFAEISSSVNSDLGYWNNTWRLESRWGNPGFFEVSPPRYVCCVFGYELIGRETAEDGVVFFRDRKETAFFDNSEYQRSKANVFESRQLESVRERVEGYWTHAYIYYDFKDRDSLITVGRAIALDPTIISSSTMFDTYYFVCGVNASFIGRFPHLVLFVLLAALTLAAVIAFVSSRIMYRERLSKHYYEKAMEKTVSQNTVLAHMTENTDVAEVCREILEEMKEPLRNTGMESYFSAEMKPLVVVDRELLKNALTMVLQHAMNYSSPGSTIKVIVTPGDICVEKPLSTKDFSDKLITIRRDIYHYENSVDLLAAKNILNLSGMDLATGLFEDRVKIRCVFKTKDFNLEK
ncbi:MAG: hypothetical protein J5825_08870 [Lachnospiraceae bacterium]|nr:hypothetical protein [Lachnospiraceae bacterium]